MSKLSPERVKVNSPGGSVNTVVPVVFLHLSERKLLKNAGKISADQAVIKAHDEFKKYRKERNKNYISDFDIVVKKYLPVRHGRTQTGLPKDKKKNAGR